MPVVDKHWLRASTRQMGRGGFRWNAKTKEAYFDVRTSSGKRCRALQSFESVEKARSAFGKFRDGAKSAPAPQPNTLGEYITRYWPTMTGKTKPSTFKKDTASVRKHIVPFFMNDRLDRIDELRVEEFVAHQRAEKITAPTVNYSLRMLRKILHNARKRKCITDVPPMPFEKEPVLRNEFTPEEQAAYLAAFDDMRGFMAYLAENRFYGEAKACHRYPNPRRFGASLKPDSDAAKVYFSRFHDAKVWFLTALHSGLRRGDVTNLRWTDINFTEGFIRKTIEKTGREATIPISGTLRKALTARKTRTVVSEFAIVNGDGHRYADDVIDNYHGIAKAIAQIERRVRIHDLRHSFGSTLASAGATELMLKDFFGHGSTKMVQRYSRPSPAAMKMIASALDGPDGMDTNLDTEDSERQTR